MTTTSSGVGTNACLPRNGDRFRRAKRSQAKGSSFIPKNSSIRIFGDVDDVPHRPRDRLKRDLRIKAELGT